MLLPRRNDPPSMELELGTGNRATITDWAFPARKGRECGERWQEGHLSPGQQPCWGVGGDREGRWGSQRTGNGGKNQYDTASQDWDTRASSKRRKAKRIKSRGIQSPAI